MIQIGNAASRLPFGLGRLFNTSGPEVPYRVDDSVYPVVEIDSLRPERAFVQSEKLFCGYADVTGGAAQKAGVTLTIPTPSATAVVVDFIEIQALAVAPQTISIYCGLMPTGGTVIVPTPRDIRLGFGQASYQSSTNYVIAGTAALTRVLNAVNDVWQITVPFVIVAPGSAAAGQTWGVAVRSETVTGRIGVSMSWRERPLSPSELTV